LNSASRAKAFPSPEATHPEGFDEEYELGNSRLKLNHGIDM